MWPLPRIVAQLRGGDGQHRPQPLAAGIDEVMRQLGDQLDVGDRLVEDDAVDRIHVADDDVEQRLQAFRGAAGRVEFDDLSQGHLPELMLVLIGI